MKASREELAAAIDEAPWDILRAHLERGGLIVLDPGLDLVDTAVKVAEDDVPAIGRLIDAGQLAKPTAEQIAAWDRTRDLLFLCLIVSPYVLIKEKPRTLQ